MGAQIFWLKALEIHFVTLGIVVNLTKWSSFFFFIFFFSFGVLLGMNKKTLGTYMNMTLEKSVSHSVDLWHKADINK